MHEYYMIIRDNTIFLMSENGKEHLDIKVSTALNMNLELTFSKQYLMQLSEIVIEDGKLIKNRFEYLGKIFKERSND